MQNTAGESTAFSDIYKIAGKIVRITSVYRDVHVLCRKYRFDGSPDFEVVSGQGDIGYERKKSENPDGEHSDGYLETLAVYRKICEVMLDYGIMLFHGSVVAVDGEGYLFTAKSGTGKSTHTRYWREVFGERAVMVNDDKPLLEVKDGVILAHGTPWDGKHRLSSNISVSLKAICILERSEQNRIEKIGRSEAYPMLLQQSYRPADPKKLVLTLNLLDKIADLAALYRLGCNMSRQAALTAYNAMKGINPNET
jgi:hypothetical protein